MGYFTWTLANRTPVIKRGGGYTARSILQYGGYGAIVCPDNSLIKEECYEGYGIFGGKDVYELVVDWNKPYLLDILKNPDFRAWGLFRETELRMYRAYATDDVTGFQAALADIVCKTPYTKTDWKRTIGIFIACENNPIIPYPIKIVDCKRPKPYEQLPPSISTQ